VSGELVTGPGSAAGGVLPLVFLPEVAMWKQVSRLHAHHGDVPAEIRLLKITEEVGEAVEALLGMQGRNPRKPSRTRDDLLDELSDVIIAAAIAMAGVAGDVSQARDHLERRLAAVCQRAGLGLPAQHDGQVDGTGVAAFTVEQVADMLNIGRDKVYYLLRTGQLKSLKIGKLRRITRVHLAEFLASAEDTHR
jgi:excisionase family DNA binding protein